MLGMNTYKLIFKTFILVYCIALAMLIYLAGNLGYIIFKAPAIGVLTDIRADTVTFGGMPPYISSVFLVAENINYLDRPGMETRAVIKSLIRGSLNNGEVPQEITIVQKLVKYAFDKPANNFPRKLQEAYLAFRLENTYNRKQILQMYINHTAFAKNVYGLSSASLYFFGKRAKDLTLPEAALLAALSKNPSPLNTSSLAQIYNARNSILLSMQKNGLLSKFQPTKAH